MKRILTLAALLLAVLPCALAQGGLSEETLAEIRSGYQGTAADKAVRNALNTTPMATLAANAENVAMIDTHFSDQVKTRGITNQKSSGRCWLFSGLNVLRAKLVLRMFSVIKRDQPYTKEYKPATCSSQG